MRLQDMDDARAHAEHPGRMTGHEETSRWARLEDLYRDHQPGLVRLATMLSGSSTLAEEIVQEAFVRLHPRLDVVEHPDAYLRTIVVNLCHGHHRRRAIALANRPDPSPDEPPPSIPFDLTEIWLALQRLPERRRVALVLRYHLDLSDDVIADHLGVRRSTVRSLVHRGLHQLREVLIP